MCGGVIIQVSLHDRVFRKPPIFEFLVPVLLRAEKGPLYSALVYFFAVNFLRRRRLPLHGDHSTILTLVEVECDSRMMQSSYPTVSRPQLQREAKKPTFCDVAYLC